MPDFFKVSFVIAALTAGVIPFKIFAGSTESSPAAAAPNNREAPGASCPVSS